MKLTRFFAVLLAVPALAIAAISDAQRNTIDQATGAKGVYTEAEDTFRVAFPRSDLKVTVEGRAMSPFLGFSSWAAFTPDAHGSLMVMGDMVLLEDEVNAALSAALDNGLEVTALHNDFFYESPRVMYMHIGGMGIAEQLAPAVKKVVDAVKGVRSGSATPAPRFAGAPVPETSSITPAPLDAIFFGQSASGQSSQKGEVNAGMYKATIGRSATMHGAKAGKQMGVNTWAAFAGSDANAMVDGDFSMTKEELQAVLKALRKAGINIVAIHNHMTNEEPQYVFLHHMGKDAAAELAKGIKAALDTQAGKLAVAGTGRTVLFVCEHGAAKSVLAAAEFNRLAEQRGLAWRAMSRGINPDPEIAPAIASALAKDGMEVKGKPALVAGSDVKGAAYTVTMGATLPNAMRVGDIREWDVPSTSADLVAARTDIRLRVEKLLDEIAHQ
jgi:protein-tyrosine-phosphatase